MEHIMSSLNAAQPREGPESALPHAIRDSGRSIPTFGGATAWLNSDPLVDSQLRDRVVLVDFWTFTCINWIRTAPYRRAWAEAYRQDGLLVVGVHTPEFTFEHGLDGVRRAVEQRDIKYPVAVDNDYDVWRSFDNHYWPALYVLDEEGAVRHRHFGEGEYETSERVIQQLLGVDRALTTVHARGDEREADWENLRSPETYLGYGRRSGFVTVARDAFDQSVFHGRPADLPLNSWALEGQWTVGRERVVLDRAHGSIAFCFRARDVHLVMAPGNGAPIPFQVLLDGEVPGPSRGADIDGDGTGILQHGRMHQLIRVREVVGERAVQITFGAPGAQCYAFTFG
jgi:thiol-disulfide isomerase/thioredoxin